VIEDDQLSCSLSGLSEQEQGNDRGIGGEEKRSEKAFTVNLIGFEVGENRIWAIGQGCKCYFY